ncbi:MerR family transcriptional regulator [Streptomyces sp. WI04-05B]|uniref:MerR family transcriptional regulator n=1 Tax=Streptomyces TaxID=1883 RepID=UPI0029A7CD82|nr:MULTISPECIES: MerR family transcriptional regulator [unclassified Streptomyces]MDX2541882.1 MerR family transcriptional regulator [Streptomyces sp. WI04-05B]MDX2586964.1 MerR family transcriptional regulator [Streptomyces sp. WI04-05A]MDX3749932.1 MerR family transcriptional regulator [Streptomyces sp. AK08-02]
MRLAELSERSGVSTATIKYYLREGLLAPGRPINTTTAEYDEGHLRRLRLVRAMIQVGRIPVATAREVLGHVDDESLGRTIRLGAALWALPQGAEPDEEDPAVVAARREVDRLLVSLGWETARELSPLSPVHRSLVTAVAALIRLGYSWDAELMAPYAELMHQVARRDLDYLETHASDAERVETAVAATVLFEPVLTALHRLAQEEESARRYGL